MAQSKKSKVTRRNPFAVRVSGKTLADHIRKPEDCAKMLARLAKSKGGLPANVLRENARMIVIDIGGKVVKVNPNGIAQLFGLVHHGWIPYMKANGKPDKAAIAEQAKLAKDGRLYHYRTLILQLARAGYKISLSKDTADQYVADGLKAAVKAGEAAKAGTK